MCIKNTNFQPPSLEILIQEVRGESAGICTINKRPVPLLRPKQLENPVGTDFLALHSKENRRMVGSLTQNADICSGQQPSVGDKTKIQVIGLLTGWVITSPHSLLEPHESPGTGGPHLCYLPSSCVRVEGSL